MPVLTMNNRGVYGARIAMAAGAGLLAIVCAAAGCRFLAQHLRSGEELSAFPHDIHVEDQEIGCEECHPQESGADLPSLPAVNTCGFCHDPEDDEDPAAPFLAGGAPSWVRAGRQSDEIMFEHTRHVEAAKGSCTACHQDVAASWAVLSSMRMRMDTCMACHQEQGASNECAACHHRLRPDTAPDSHREGWTLRHGQRWRSLAGGRTVDRCDLCHTQGSCDECHTTVRPRSHNNYWRGRGHGVAAGIDRSSCSVCHGRDTCDRCHSRTRPRSHRGSFGAPRNRHCYQCHLPLVHRGYQRENCSVCHLDTPSHSTAEIMPADAAHQTASAAQCRACHAPLPHPDNGDDCRFCHE